MLNRNLNSLLHLLKKENNISFSDDIITHMDTGISFKFEGLSNVYTYKISILSHPRKYLVQCGPFHIRPGQIIEILKGEE